jgi:hypothetical protein
MRSQKNHPAKMRAAGFAVKHEEGGGTIRSWKRPEAALAKDQAQSPIHL